MLWPNNFHIETLENIAIDSCSTPQKAQPANYLQPEKARGNWTSKMLEGASFLSREREGAREEAAAPCPAAEAESTGGSAKRGEDVLHPHVLRMMVLNG